MGYRSQVGLVVKTEVFDARLAEEPQEVQDLVRDLLSHADDHETAEGFELYAWYDIKWYSDSYSTVSWLENYWKATPETSSFIRLGEDAEDVEEELCETHECPFYLSWNRQIKWY